MKLRRMSLMLALLAIPILGAAALGSRAPASSTLMLGDADAYYLSPRSSPGTKDELTLPLSATVARNRVVSRYLVSINNHDGSLVRSMETVYEGPKPGLFRKAQGLALPSEISWDAKDNNDQYVAEGSYTLMLEIWDDKGALSASSPIAVTVDNTAPAIKVTIPNFEFSPGGEGRKLLVVEQDGSSELEWTGMILATGGKKLKSLVWKDGRPENFSWDGKDDTGAIVGDGSYSYRVEATDQAGNATTQTVEGIIVDTVVSTVELQRDLGAFSPNGDGERDALSFAIGISAPQNVVQWNIDILNGKGALVRSIKGSQAPTASIVFDGRDDKGAVLAEGGYQPALAVLFKNGTRLSAKAPSFIIDLSPPKASVTASRAVFSPNGDGQANRVDIKQLTSREESWTGEFRDANGKIVKKAEWRELADGTYTWNGKDSADAQLPDGDYTYTLTGIDSAGNKASSNTITLTLKSEVRDAISLSVEGQYFSPNGDGTKDLVIMRVAPVASADLSLSLTITSADKKPIRSLFADKKLAAEERALWDGKNDAGVLVADGGYFALLLARDAAGNTKSVERSVYVDTQKPSAQLSLDYSLFSPDGDKAKDELVLKQATSAEENWKGEFSDAEGKVIRTFYWKGQAPSFAWDGKDAEGTLAPDGNYSYTLSSSDAAGNGVTARAEGIRIDARPTPAEISVGAATFSPNGDGVMDTLNLFIYAKLKDGVDSWRLAVLDAKGQAVKVFSGDRVQAIPDEVVWNGLNDAGEPSPEGDYTAALDIVYAKGNKASHKTPAAFAIDRLGPTLELALVPWRFSPNGDGVDDTISIQLKASDNKAITAWSVTILDPTGEAFKKFSGSGAPPARIEWNGKSDKNELVQAVEEYPLVVELRDASGNVTTKRSLINVDVFVTTIDGKLRIEVSSLIFAPDTAEFLNFGKYADFYAGQAEKNARVLDEIARILKQYGDYSILIEGHGVLVTWKDPAKSAVEQKNELVPLTKSRAEAVKAALIQRGIEAARLDTVGIGGIKPAYPFSDLENRWKNRRVVFILEKK